VVSPTRTTSSPGPAFGPSAVARTLPTTRSLRTTDSAYRDWPHIFRGRKVGADPLQRDPDQFAALDSLQTRFQFGKPLRGNTGSAERGGGGGGGIEGLVPEVPGPSPIARGFDLRTVALRPRTVSLASSDTAAASGRVTISKPSCDGVMGLGNSRTSRYTAPMASDWNRGLSESSAAELIGMRAADRRDLAAGDIAAIR